MNNEKETLKKQSMKATIKLSLFLSFILICFEIIFCFLNKIFILFSWISILPLIHILKRKNFFKHAVFCYGKIIDVTLGDYDDIVISTKIEFKDSYSNKIYETYVCEHWGDFNEELKDEIDTFYKNGKERIGKKVPLFYKIKNPNKNLVFINNIENWKNKIQASLNSLYWNKQCDKI